MEEPLTQAARGRRRYRPLTQAARRGWVGIRGSGLQEVSTRVWRRQAEACATGGAGVRPRGAGLGRTVENPWSVGAPGVSLGLRWGGGSGHVFDDGGGEFGGFYLGCAFHLAVEVVGDLLLGYGSGDSLFDQGGGFLPVHEFEHHDPGEHDAGGVDDVEIGVFGGGAVGRLKDGVGVADVGSGGHSESADLGGAGVGEVVAIEVGGGEDVVFAGAEEDLLEDGVGDAVLHEELAGGDFALDFGFGDADIGELLLHEFIAPVAEGAFGELHDVALVDQGDRPAAVGEGEFDGLADEAFGTEDAHGLDADAGVEPDLGSHFLGEEFDDLLGFGGAFTVFDAGIDVFGVLAEDDDVELFGPLHGRGDAGVVLDGALADVEVEDLAQADVERADAAADGRGERAFDGDMEAGDGVEGVLGEPTLDASKAFSPARTSNQAILRLPA